MALLVILPPKVDVEYKADKGITWADANRNGVPASVSISHS
jgi:hypothetical protein